MGETRTYRVKEREDEGKRLDKFLAEMDDHHLSRSRIQDLIAEGRVKVAGETKRKASYGLSSGQMVELDVPPVEEPTVEPQLLELDVVYEDEWLVVVNKGRGMVVHPAPGHEDGTLVNALLAHVDKLAPQGSPQRPGIVHRLDKDTTGLMVVAKTAAAYDHLVNQFKQRKVTKDYLALVHGTPEVKRGLIEAPIGRDPAERTRMAVRLEGKEARTRFYVKEDFDKFSLLLCRLETGRTHQIRVHLAYIDHPMVGDGVYGKGQELGMTGQALHAHRLKFSHPSDGRDMDFRVPMPQDMLSAVQGLRSG